MHGTGSGIVARTIALGAVALLRRGRERVAAAELGPVEIAMIWGLVTKPGS
jgi:hypothetical protein